MAWTRALSPVQLFGFAATAATIIATLVIGLTTLRSVYDASAMTAHTYSVISALRQLLATSIDAETGQRGFLITGAPSYLEPFDRARANLTAQIGQLRTLTGDNSEQQADIDRLSAVAEAKFAELEETIQLRRDDDLAAARALVLSHEGKRTMDEMRQIVERMEARENALLSARTAQANRNYRQAIIARYTNGAVGMLALGALFVVALRYGANRERALESAERFRVTLASIGDAVIATDVDGRVTQMNAIAEGLTGWTQAEASGRPLDEVFVIVNEESRRPVETPVAVVLRERKIVDLANHTMLVARSGNETAIDDSAAPIMSAAGRIVGVVLVFRDVTERRRVERMRDEALTSQQESARFEAEANRAKDEFLAMVSHELRNPLHAIVGWTELLRRGALDDAGRQRALAAVYSNARRQAVLIDELLDISRMTSGKLRLNRIPADLITLLEGAIDVVQPAADRKRLHITTNIDAAIEPFAVDPERLQQVLGNLLSNAVKFTPDGGAIDVTLRRIATGVEFVIADTGEGIPPHLLDAVFERFRQVDGSTSHRQGGLGLGLAIVKHLVEAHGGTVTASSEGEGTGTTVTVRLPFVAQAETDPDGLDASSKATAAAPRLAGFSVLVVDDDADSHELLATALDQAGAAVLTASSADEALDLLQTSRVHAMVSDIAMPGADGSDLIRRVRRLGGPPAAIPAIALTSLTREQDRRDAIAAGFHRHLSKPVDLVALVRTVAELVAPLQAS
jgi:PAS domain S-box-containing protein